MPDETKVIEPLFGPHFGGHISVPAAEAEAAIAEGWARDPYATEPYEPVERTAEERAELEASALKASRKWRGEEDPDEAGTDTKSKSRSMEADQGKAPYSTRTTSSRKK